MVTYHFSNSQGAGGRQPKPGKIHRLYEAGGFYVAKRPPPRELDQATMTKQAKDRALVFHKVFSQVAGGVAWIIDLGYVNYGGVCEGLPPKFQKGLRYVRPAGSNMDVRPAMLRQFPDQDVLEILKVFPDLPQKKNPASFHQVDALRWRPGSGWVRGERYHAQRVPGTYPFPKAKRLWDFTFRAPP